MTMMDTAALLSDRLSAVNHHWGYLPPYVLVRMAALVGDVDPLYFDGNATYSQEGPQATYSGTLIVVARGRFVVTTLWDAVTNGAGGGVTCEAFPWRPERAEMLSGVDNKDASWSVDGRDWPTAGRIRLTFDARPEPLTLPVRPQPTADQLTRLAVLVPQLLDAM